MSMMHVASNYKPRNHTGVPRPLKHGMIRHSKPLTINALPGESNDDLDSYAYDIDNQAEKYKKQATEVPGLKSATAFDISRGQQEYGEHIRGQIKKNVVIANEFDMNRLPYHRQLTKAMLEGDPAKAEQIMSEMTRDKLPPGPRAYHAMIGACARARNPEWALKKLQRASNANIKPLPESYAVVIHSLLSSESQLSQPFEVTIEDAHAVFISCCRMYQDRNDRYKAWLELVVGLFERGYYEKVFQDYLYQGIDGGMQPNDDVYKYVIRYFCEREGTPEELEENLEVAKAYLEAMIHQELKPAPSQYADLLLAYTKADKLDMAESLLPNIPATAARTRYKCLRALATRYLDIKTPLDQETKAHMIRHTEELALYTKSLATPPREQAMLRLFLLSAAIELGGKERVTAAFNAVLSCRDCIFDGDLLISCYNFFSDNTLPLQISQLFLRSRWIPAAAMSLDSAGRTFLSRWLGKRMEDKSDSFKSGYVVIDGVLVDRKTMSVCLEKSAVKDPGHPKPEIRMSLAELRAELRLRGRDFGGTKKQMVVRLKKARLIDQEGHDIMKTLFVEGDMENQPDGDLDGDDDTLDGKLPSVETEGFRSAPRSNSADDERDLDDDSMPRQFTKFSSSLDKDLDVEFDLTHFCIAGDDCLNEYAGPAELLQLLTTARKLGAQPSSGDLATLTDAIEVLMDPRLARQALDSQFALETDMSKRLQRVEIDGKLPVPSEIKRAVNKKSSPMSDMLALQSAFKDLSSL